MDPLSDEQFALPQTVIEDEDLQVLYHDVLRRLRTENSDIPGASVLNDILAERLAFTYVWVRQKERQNLEERKHKEMNAQFLDLVRTMYSVKRADSDLDALKTMILDKVTDAVSGALAEIGGETADEVREKLVESFRAAGL
jgi:hypothetical protein